MSFQTSFARLEEIDNTFAKEKSGQVQLSSEEKAAMQKEKEKLTNELVEAGQISKPASTSSTTSDVSRETSQPKKS